MANHEQFTAIEQLWQEQHKSPLSPEEKAFLCALMDGDSCKHKKDIQPVVIRADVLTFILAQTEVPFKFPNKDIHIEGIGFSTAPPLEGEENQLDLQNLKLEANLIFQNCTFTSKINLNNADIKSLKFDQCTLEELRLDGAMIDGDLKCVESRFLSSQHALFCNRANIQGTVVLGAASQYMGQVSFVNAKIGADFSAESGSFSGSPALNLRGATILGIFHWRDIKACNNALVLSNMSCKALNFDDHSWQLCSEVNISNLSYEGFSPIPDNANGEFWCRFLDHQPENHLNAQFRPKPFETLSQVLTNMGMVEEAIAVKIHKERVRTRFMQEFEPKPNGTWDKISRHLRLFSRRWIYGALIAYGYRPSRALYYLAAIGLLGGFIYWWAAIAGIMTPSHPLIFKEAHAQNGLIPKACAKNWVYFPKEIAEECSASMPSEYSEFQPFLYSFDVLLPIINLRQEVDWAPRVVHHDGTNWWAGRLIRIWEWLEIAAGWLLSLLLVSAIGGIIRR